MTEFDIIFDFGDFNSTTAEVTAVSQKGKELFSVMFGTGSVSVKMPKTKGFDFMTFVKAKGLKVN
jgi:hypothetical protein